MSPGRWLRILERRRSPIAVALLVILAADVWALTRGGSTAVPVAEVVSRFREESAASSPVPDTAVPPAGNTTSTARRTTTSTFRPSSSPSTSRPPDAVAPPLAQLPASVLKPAPGVYRYRTEGYERLSLLGAHRSYPAETTRVVRHGSGCAWTMRVVLSVEHQEEHGACSTSTGFDVTENTTDVAWFGISLSTRLVCDPGIRQAARAATPGTVTRFVCQEQGGASTFSGTSTVVGDEIARVGTEGRDAWRIRIEGSFTGSTRGTVVVTELIDKEKGSVLFEQRVNELRRATVLGDITYHQELTLVLVSLAPLR